MVTAWRQKLGRGVDGASLAVFRMGFGAVVFWEVLRYFYYDWVSELFVKPSYLFAFPWCPVSPLPRGGMSVLFLVVGLAGCGVCLGLFFRLASLIAAFGLAYVFLLDASYSLDLNHLYLMVLLAFLLAASPAANAWSLDNRVFGRAPRAVPFWSIFLVRAQVLVVFFFAGVAKLGSEWRSGEPAARMLTSGSAPHWLDPLLRAPGADQMFTYGGLVFDLAVPVLLLLGKTRRLGILLVVAFFAVNALLFPIGVFPAMGILAVLLFLKPEWPRFGFHTSGVPVGERSLSTAGLAVCMLYVLLQNTVPLRSVLYPSPTEWSEEGQFFSWRMMGLDKRGTLVLTVRNPSTGQEAVWDLQRELTPRQIYSLSTRPLLVHQYARHVADEVERYEHFRPEVFARQSVRLGRHPEQLAIDPHRDLAKEPFRLSSYDWLIPLTR